MNDTLPSGAASYGTTRQHAYSSLAATTNACTTLLDPTSFNTYLDYTLSVSNQSTGANEACTLGTKSRKALLSSDSSTARALNTLSAVAGQPADGNIAALINQPTQPTKDLPSLTPLNRVGKAVCQLPTPAASDESHASKKPTLVEQLTSQQSAAKLRTASASSMGELVSHRKPTNFALKYANMGLAYRSSEANSAALQLLTAERNARIATGVDPFKGSANFSEGEGSLSALVDNSATGALGNLQSGVTDQSVLA